MERMMKKWFEKAVETVLCHRAMHGLAAGVYGASASGMLGKEVVAWALCGVYAVMFLRK